MPLSDSLLNDPVTASIPAAEAALTLEAMRLGVVPSTRVEAYTVGRDEEMAAIAADLGRVEADGGAVRVFLGDYGTGKTHLLEIAQLSALARGHLCARVVLDPSETSPSQPKRVFRAAMRSLRYPDRSESSGLGLRPLLQQAIDNDEALAAFDVKPAKGRSTEQRLEQGYHLYLSPALSYFKTLSRPLSRPPRKVDEAQRESWLEQQSNLLFEWLEGHPTVSNQLIDEELHKLPGHHPKIYSLLDYRPWSRIYGYLLSGIARLARAVGYQGLTVLLDEAEFYALLSPQNRAFARFLFKAWSAAAIGGEVEKLSLDEEGREVGGYGIQRELPVQYHPRSGLYLILAMTPTADGLAALEGAIPPDAISSLVRLEPIDYVNLVRRVFEFYASARPDWVLPAALLTPLTEVVRGLLQTGVLANPRHAMKFIIDFIDVVHYYPDRVLELIRGLQQTLVGS
ncbi:MAG: DUF2791 family P-loop domain-containing protein [Myxococcota bacterium]|jgi:hypothetical protein|nr:DUF2791 family P-loop domain-containing protein [Myxococcota bacterium]